MKTDRYTFPVAAFAIIAGLVVSFFNAGSPSPANDTAPATAITVSAQ